MPVGVTIELPDVDAGVYDKVMDALDWDNAEKPAGFISHYAGPVSGGWLVFDVWESQADFERFAGERLGSAMATAMGGEPPAIEPTFIPIHKQSHAG